jgi:hypothetical protein
MSKLSKYSPIARAIAVIGATAGLVTGVTFAALTSNTVALTPNTVTVATASLVIGAGSDCTEVVTTSTAGINAPALAPGSSVTPVTFCIKNTGGVALNLSAAIPEAATLATDSGAQALNFGISCGALGSPTTLLSAWSPEPFAGGSLAAGATVVCTATATLSGSYSVSGHVIPAFSVQFTGTQA